MRSIAMILLALGLVAVAMGGCAKQDEPGTETPTVKPSDMPAKPTMEAACICDKGKAGDTVWCPDCDVGYHGGEKMACKGCWSSKQGGPACQTCANK